MNLNGCSCTRVVWPQVHVAWKIGQIQKGMIIKINVKVLFGLQEALLDSSWDYGIPWVFITYISKLDAIKNEWLEQEEKKT
jgi:hypothetical protein